MRAGVPAHLTVLYPFMPASVLTEEVVSRCRELCSGTGPLTVRFERCEVAPGIVGLPPVPSGPIEGLTRSFVEEWPDYRPYGGAYGDTPAAHATAALGAAAEEANAIAAWASALLPVTAELRAAVLVELTASGWAERARLML
ncbi:2'-5' RNA ligase family protein [Pseudonocardia sp. H11422]|uniref:2'-5' RNA ligase family protein n=1 Tax=Pseudonocardia sp. H11422 TaxID=2835866 RepID=UPI002930478F|nr:2'-5' RNA ligase family protein [Pseudonocardia sp. H11422]